MNSVLHILNGDSTAYSFKDTGLDGDILVWREVLSQGPLIEDISSAAFWEMRSEWICKGLNETPENYRKKVIEPLEKLSNIYDEITLWFEFDLHCQINMLGVMEMMLKHTDLSIPKIYLVCPGECAGVEDFRGMGQLNGSQLAVLYDDRLRLNDWDFTLASQAWKLYVSGDDMALEKWINETNFWGSLHLLKPALLAHLKRVRVNDAGLNHIEQTLLDIYSSGTRAKYAIYEAFWKAEKIYGMGDLEIDIYLRSLADKNLLAMPT
ncbi:MAG: DUF1835 domain-containing protein [Mucilaginibacter sp.]|nr:DUF1835 domain-containing protein [Mucilaginibacter sp.]